MPCNLRVRSARQILSQSIYQGLNLYSIAATAAGVSALALAQPAECEVVVTQKSIPINTGSPVFIDLNKDGVADFELSLTSFRDGKFHETLIAKRLTGGEVVGRNLYSRGPYASALVRGARIGPSAHFSSSHGQITIEREVHYSSVGLYYGNWYNAGSNRFLGVKFLIKGQTHFGWIRLTVGIPGGFASTKVSGYAYETIANKSITAGESHGSVESTDARSGESEKDAAGPSLGMLALGWDGLGVWRREQDSIR